MKHLFTFLLANSPISYPGNLHTALIEFIKAIPSVQKVNLTVKLSLIIWLFWLLQKSNYKPSLRNLFLLTCALIILIFRLPYTLLPEQNLDESVYIAGTGVLLNDPRIWQSFDCLTVGPLNSYFLSLSYWLFGSVNYTTIRIVGILFCYIPSLICLFFSVKYLYNVRLAYSITALYALFCASLTLFDFTGYSSELIPHLLLSIELLCFSAVLSGRSFRYAYGLCLVAGLMPYAKLQGVLMAGIIVLFLFIEVRKQLSVQKAVALITCGLAPTALLSIYLAVHSLFIDFIYSYLLFNAEYSGSLSDMKWWLVPNLIVDSPDISPFCLSIVLILAIGLASLLIKGVPFQRKLIVYCTLLLAVIWYSVIKPGQSFNHYLVFFFFPFFWSLSIVLGEFLNQTPQRYSLLLITIFSLFAAFTVWPLRTKNTGIEYALHFSYQPDPLVATVQKLARPTDRMSIWGHGNLAHLYCYTSLLPGTRDVFASRQINPSSLQSYFILRYAADLHQNHPRFILEDDRYEPYQIRLETVFPDLNRTYHLQARNGSINIYIRND
ncbi:hypothetical protein ACO2Q8_18045 [Larkinella sp. VNQ87]|uniref:hypothetical protein n=1 Tax=Larkinella sp. VNQ87 TaxID=3400921 RepID=UPI003C0A2AD0